jgi:DNA topoisomerase-1
MIKLKGIYEQISEEEMNSEDLENCDEYPLPDWWDDDEIELQPIKKEIKELEFQDDSEFNAYASKHSIRDTTKVKIGDRETTAGAAKQVGKKKVVNPNIPNPHFRKKYGKLKLNAYPPIGVDEKDVKVNTEGNIHTHAVLQWKDPKSGRTISAYTPRFMARNAKIKWKRVQRIKEEYVDRIFDKSIKALRSRNPIEREAGAIISIISKTGLRPGSMAGYNDTGNRGVSTLGPENVKIDGDKITINFVGKSFQENNAEFRNPELAKYLSKKIQEKKGEKFLFDVSAGQVRNVFNKKLGRKGMKIKDLRTYTATKMASNILKNNDLPPSPLPEKQSEIKKAVKKKLNAVFDEVSKKLNNTPAMTKSSYVHPKVIDKWLEEIGVKPKKKK